jgi:hypothetical protein
MAEKLVPGGFLGASLIAGGGGGLFLSEPVSNAEADMLLRGEVVRISGNSAVLRAQANLPANVVGLAGVMFNDTATGGLGSVATSGRAFVLLEPALVPVAGQALWVSAATAGRATNVAPALPVYLGVIKDASGYATTGGVLADLAPNYALSAAAFNTLHAAYNAGTLAADQTMSLLDAHGGGVVIDGTGGGFTSTLSLAITSPGGGFVYFPRVGGMQMVDNHTIAVPAALTTWRALELQLSRITLTAGGVAPSRLDFAYLAAPEITQTAGVAYVIPACSTLYIEGPPTASAVGGATPTLTAAGVAAFVVASGNVGFGTATPSSLLHLSSTGNTFISLTDETGGTGDTWKLRSLSTGVLDLLGSTGNTVFAAEKIAGQLYVAFGQAASPSASYGVLIFADANTGATEGLHVQNNGAGRIADFNNIGGTVVSIANSGAVKMTSLAGVGSRTVVADANGVLTAP